jgi:hypothetical protein
MRIDRTGSMQHVQLSFAGEKGSYCSMDCLNAAEGGQDSKPGVIQLPEEVGSSEKKPMIGHDPHGDGMGMITYDPRTSKQPTGMLLPNSTQGYPNAID